jgi:hypothetical protein
MDAILRWIGEHQVLCGYALAMVVSAAFRALPEPEPGNDKFYRWLYNLGQQLHANADKVRPLVKSPVRHWLDDQQDFKP